MWLRFATLQQRIAMWEVEAAMQQKLTLAGEMETTQQRVLTTRRLEVEHGTPTRAPTHRRGQREMIKQAKS